MQVRDFSGSDILAQLQGREHGMLRWYDPPRNRVRSDRTQRFAGHACNPLNFAKITSRGFGQSSFGQLLLPAVPSSQQLLQIAAANCPSIAMSRAGMRTRLQTC